MESVKSLSSHERFVAAFERLNITQDVAAEILGLSQKTVSNYLAGKSEPPQTYIEALEGFTEDDKRNGNSLVKRLESLLWRIGSEYPQSRTVIQEMLQQKDKIKELLQ